MAVCGVCMGAHRLEENGAAPSWQMMVGRGGTNVRFRVSQQAAKPVYVSNRNEPIRTHTHRVIVLRDSSSSMTRIG